MKEGRGTRGQRRRGGGAFIAASLIYSAMLFSGEAAPEKELNAADTKAALKSLTENFRAHPAFRAKMTVRVTDLIGERVEEGWLAIARPGKVLRRFEKPSSKIWFLDGASLRELSPGKNEIYEKDFSVAPRLLKLAQAALGGDVQALEEWFTFRVFSSADAVRVELSKKSGAPKLLHRTIRARMKLGGLFFNEIRYEPESGDEIVETFSEFKELGGENAEEFKVEWPKDAVVKTTRLTE